MRYSIAMRRQRAAVTFIVLLLSGASHALGAVAETLPIRVEVNPNGSFWIEDTTNHVRWGSDWPGWVTLRCQIDGEMVERTIPPTTSKVKADHGGIGCYILIS
jgi:hypothetical protein